MCRTVRRSSILAACLILLAACTDSTSPVGAARAAKLSAVQTTTLSIMVGSDLPDWASVVATDAGGKPVSGVQVVFSSSAGVLPAGVVFTNEKGVATLAHWFINTAPGDNVVTATAAGLPQVTFLVKGQVGPPDGIYKITGDGQVALAGAEAPVSPSVYVVDRYANAVADAHVKFAIRAGGGTLASTEVLTDAVGIAKAGWTLGTEREQIVSAQVDSLLPVFFTATSVRPDEVCEAALQIPRDMTVTCDLNEQSSQGSDGKFRQELLLDLQSANAWQFALRSDDFDTVLELRDDKGVLIASNDNTADTTRNSGFRAILPAGRFALTVTTALPNTTGHYSLHYSLATSQAKCGDAFIARGVHLEQWMEGLTCGSNEPVNVDKFQVTLEAGVPLHLQLLDESYNGPTLELRNEKGEVVATGIYVSYYTQTIDFTPSAAATYTVVITSADGELIKYRLNVN